MEMDSKYSDTVKPCKNSPDFTCALVPAETNDTMNAAVLYLFPKRFGTSLTQ